MKALICKKCLNIPYVEFIPGLIVKFSCCSSILVYHFDLDKEIEDNFTLKCSKKFCSKMSTNFNYISGSVICDDCLKIFNANKEIQKINLNSLGTICLYHKEKYKYYSKDKNILYCDSCLFKKENVYELKNFRKEENKEKLNINIEDECPINDYFKILFERINRTYEIFIKNNIPNAYFNLKNLNNFLDDFNIISPFCPKCNKIYHINIYHKSLSNINKGNIIIKIDNIDDESKEIIFYLKLIVIVQIKNIRLLVNLKMN